MTQGLTDPSAPFFKFEVDYDEPPRPISIAGRGYVGGKAIGLLYAAGPIPTCAVR